ncbi:MAG: hypothetical protein VB106_00550 [Clostridiaceae bacterium]|nr:hypothetical protein [Clostridiaceae bacterium]
MTGKKHSMLKAAMLITFIMALNFVGISYGQWQNSLVSIIKAHTGYIELSFEEDPKVEEPEGFSEIDANRKNDKTIEVTGKIESNTTGEFRLNYSIENDGSLSVEFDDDEFDEILNNIPMANGFSIIGGPNRDSIGYKGSSLNIINGSIAISIDASEIYDPQEEPLEGESLESDSTDEDIYEFEIVLPYKISSWTDALTIRGEIEIVQAKGLIKMLAPVPAMTSAPVLDAVEGEVPDSLAPDPIPEGPSDQELYGEGGTTDETDEPETTEGDSEPESADEGEEEVTNKESEEDGGDGAIQEDSEPASEDEEEEEGMDEQKQDDADGTDEGSDSGELSPDTGENN